MNPHLDSGFAPPRAFEEYELIRELGHGAMGTVHLARDLLLDRLVAIKFISVEPTTDARRRFFREARALARLTHPNVVRVYRVGEVRRCPYLVSEWIDGDALDAIARPVPCDDLRAIARGLSRGLAAAHRRGILHRDIKPSNAMRGADGEIKLLDFGLAKAMADGGEDASSSALPARGREAITVDAWVGTPLYMAPELWAGQPATPRSDVYGLGALLYELAAGRAPHAGVPADELPVVSARRVAPLHEVAPGVDEPLAELIDRCLDPDPRKRFDSAETLRDALDALERARLQPVARPVGNPYRGLEPFELKHRPWFFGRDADIDAVIERLRSDPVVVVAGDSGVGKSSVCRAGVAFAVADGALDGEWVTALWIAGTHPLRSLSNALAPVVGDAIRDALDDPPRAARKIERALDGRNLLLIADQTEELFTRADERAAEQVGALIETLSRDAPSVRLLATVRSDYLGRLAALPEAGERLSRAFYVLRPLRGEALRQVIRGPAQAADIELESEDLVDALVAGADQPGGLPLLQFALSQLWDRRDPERGVIPDAALTEIGGVAGALAQHADGVLGALPPQRRALAREIFGRLVTPEGTRARRTAEELGTDAETRAVLEHLVRGRLLVARESDDGAGTTCEIAHEALIDGWQTLRAWLDENAAARAIRERLAVATRDWERLEHDRDVLWSRRQLADACVLDSERISEAERAFVAASRRRARASLALRIAGLSVIPLAALTLLGGWQWQKRARERAAVGEHLQAATAAADRAHRAWEEAADVRARALASFDAFDVDQGERLWAGFQASSTLAEESYRRASGELEQALAYRPRREDVREKLAHVLAQRVRVARARGRAEQADELLERLDAYGTAEARELSADVPVEIHASVPARMRLIRYVPDGTGRIVERAPEIDVPNRAPATLSLPAGSWLLELRAEGYADLRLPFVVEPAAPVDLDVEMLAEQRVPAGLVYVPAGVFLHGSDDHEEIRRGFFAAAPLHTVETKAYLIARTEVTFAEWMEFLDALPPAERALRTPKAGNLRIQHLSLERRGDAWSLELETPAGRLETDRKGRLHYPDRERNALVDWKRTPVAAISFEDAQAYTKWLRTTGRVPGARLCDEREWERAARGADGRRFPHGNVLRPQDANFDRAYGRRPGGFGPDAVGSHPVSDSPFGLSDTSGNVWEWVRSTEDGSPVIRGGSWYQDHLTARLENREPTEPTMRDPLVGLRVCADPPG